MIYIVHMVHAVHGRISTPVEADSVTDAWERAARANRSCTVQSVAEHVKEERE